MEIESIPTEIELFLGLAEVKKFNHLKEVYFYAKEKASTMVRDILDQNEPLRKKLILLATHYSSTTWIDGVKIVDPQDEMEDKLIEISHLYFDFDWGCAHIHMMLNLNNYLNKDSEIIYAVFVYSQDGQDITYSEELSGDKHDDLDIPDSVFFRQLPLIYALGLPEHSEAMLIDISQRTSSIPFCEHIDVKTGKVVERENF